MLIAFITTLFAIPVEIVYWIKWFIAYIAIRFYNKSHGKRFHDLYSFGAIGDPEKLGYLVPKIETDLESPQSETHLEKAADEILFYGVNSKAECLLVRITRGINQEAEAWIYLKLANGKTYHLTEHVNCQQPFEDKCVNFSSGNLQMCFLTPMRRWRIHYCGMLTEQSESKGEPERQVFVKFAFLWGATSDIYDLSPASDINKFTNCIATTDWSVPFSPPIKELTEALNFYCQIGTFRGTISVEDGSDYTLFLFGEKMRNLGKSSSIAGCSFQHLLGYVPQHGIGVHLSSASVPKLFKDLPFGFVLQPSGDLENIKDLDIMIKPFSTVTKKRDFHAKFNSGTAYEIDGSVSGEPIILYSGQGWSGSVEVSFVSFEISNKTGYGLLMSGEVYNEPAKSAKPINRMPAYPKVVPFTVKFTDEISQFGDVSGGKGSSLGKLTKLSRTNKTFIVPKGIVVTTSALEAFLTTDILNAIKNLENITYGKSEGDVKTACDLVAKNIINTSLNNQICQSIIDDLKQVFGENFKDNKFAVRSSATGEDTETMSAAGQMDTFLGIQGLQEIFLAIKKCWASQFGTIAVEYKRQNGQPLNCPMAVVVQEMVACEVSGVLFTCDPVNNNPSIITVTANYGLGETVVSGSVEPDTIMLRRTATGDLEVKSVNVGSKHQKIVMNEFGGTITEDLPEDSKSEACISIDTAKILAKLAINVEKFYGSARDIEWGIRNNKIHLLQSRPVTNSSALTEFEIKHEFDSVVRTERDYFTIANVGEVLPGATSPLGMDLVTKVFTNSLGRGAELKGQTDLFFKSHYFEPVDHSFYYHCVWSVPELVCRYGHDTMFSKGFAISIFGRILEEPEIYELAKEKYPGTPPSSLWKDFQFIKDLFFYTWSIKQLKKDIYSYENKALKCKTAEETFKALMEAVSSDFFEAFFHHFDVSGNSSNWNIFIFYILYKAKGRFDTDVYSDFGRILGTSSNLESADVPSSLQNLGKQIAKDIGVEKFKAMNVEDANKWLNTSDSAAGQMYRQFIKRHGHRCLKEFDIYSKTWEQDQKMLINLLQTLTGCAKDVVEKPEEDNSKIFSELRVPLNLLSRLLLRFVIPHCRKGVRTRETTKSIAIKSVNHWRQGFHHLAKLMVSEGRIPSTDVIYFMTLEELRLLLETRDPKLIARANQRKKMFPILDQYKFPEIMRGFPKPINEEDESSEATEYIADLTLQGIPVCQGVVKGYARVATSMDQAALLKPGEILIAYSTDIGWSPYFPIIAGVVTELGGLISHGAVVSREYGLPCVVGLQGATQQFKTGDYVLLDGKKGLLQRLPKPQA